MDRAGAGHGHGHWHSASCGGGSQSAAPAGSGSAAPAASGTAAPADDGDPVYGGTFTTYWSEYYNEYDASANDNRNFSDLYCNSLWAVDVDKTDSPSARPCPLTS